MAPTWLTKMRALATSNDLRAKVAGRLNRSVAAVTAVTVIGGGTAFAVLPAIDSQPISAVPVQNNIEAFAFDDHDFAEFELAARNGASRASREGARGELSRTAGLSDEQATALEQGGQLGSVKATGKPGSMWTTTTLKVRETPAADGKEVTVLAEGHKVSTTGWKNGDWVEITVNDKPRWVAGKYLSATEPAPPPTTQPRSSGGSSGSGSGSSGSSSGSGGGSTDGPAATGGSGSCSSQLPGLTSRARTLHNAICANYPSITSYGGVRADAYPAHPSGRAIDAMIPNWSTSSGNALGWSLAKWLRANAGTYGISEIIFDQQIWTAQRSGDGWRMMSDRGSANANHRNHVHVAVR